MDLDLGNMYYTGPSIDNFERSVTAPLSLESQRRKLEDDYKHQAIVKLNEVIRQTDEDVNTSMQNGKNSCKLHFCVDDVTKEDGGVYIYRDLIIKTLIKLYSDAGFSIKNAPPDKQGRVDKDRYIVTW